MAMDSLSLIFLLGARKSQFKHQIQAFFLEVIQQFKSNHRNQKEMADSSLQTKKYSKYTRQMRLKLIKFVDQDKLSTAHAARILGIKQTSACRILRSYHKHNKIFEKKTDKLNREKIQAERLSQKDSDLQNIRFQQKKPESIKKISETGTVMTQSLMSISLNSSYLQNTGITQLAFSGQGMGLLFHPIINFSNDYYPIYCPNVCPLAFNYF